MARIPTDAPTSAVALNLFTNYFNHVADTEVDFPAAPALPAA